jgi:hypothetical protein
LRDPNKTRGAIPHAAGKSRRPSNDSVGHEVVGDGDIINADTGSLDGQAA